jgi:hypothetical protein
MEYSKNELDKMTPFEKKSCYDCGHLTAALFMYCTNKDAIKSRGTTIPGCVKCPYWKPDWSMISKEYRTKENGYVAPSEKIEIATKNFIERIKLFFRITNKQK